MHAANSQKWNGEWNGVYGVWNGEWIRRGEWNGVDVRKGSEATALLLWRCPWIVQESAAISSRMQEALATPAHLLQRCLWNRQNEWNLVAARMGSSATALMRWGSAWIAYERIGAAARADSAGTGLLLGYPGSWTLKRNRDAARIASAAAARLV